MPIGARSGPFRDIVLFREYALAQTGARATQ